MNIGQTILLEILLNLSTVVVRNTVTITPDRIFHEAVEGPTTGKWVDAPEIAQGIYESLPDLLLVCRAKLNLGTQIKLYTCRCIIDSFAIGQYSNLALTELCGIVLSRYYAPNPSSRGYVGQRRRQTCSSRI